MTRLIYKFGQGRGFGAELMETLWLSYRCRLLSIEFALQLDDDPRGVAVAEGWSDYFVPAFPTVRAKGPRARLNRHMYSRFEQTVTRPAARLLLNNLYRSRNYYIFDHQRIERQAAPLQKRAETGVEVLPTIREHAAEVYRLLPSVVAQTQQVSMSRPYIAIHIRRGDKITEASYAELELYRNAIEQIPNWQQFPLYILSDSALAVAEFLDLVKPGAVLGSSQNAGPGYDQRAFNLLAPERRRAETLHIVADLEIARRSAYFVGTSTSNVMWLMRVIHERGSIAIRDVHQS